MAFENNTTPAAPEPSAASRSKTKKDARIDDAVDVMREKWAKQAAPQTQDSAQEPPSAPQPPAVLEESQLLSGGTGASLLRHDSNEYDHLLFQAMWTEDDSNSNKGDKRVLNLIVTDRATKQRITQSKVKKDKQGNEFTVVETTNKSIAPAPIVPLAMVKIINSAGALTGNRYLARVGTDHEVYFPFGVGRATIQALQEQLNTLGVVCDEHEVVRLARSFAMVCNQEKLLRGRQYRDAFEQLNPGVTFTTRQAQGNYVKPDLSFDGLVFIDEGRATTTFGAPTVSYAYSEPGWNPRLVQNPATEQWEEQGRVHVLEGDRLYAGSSLYRSGGGGVVHQGKQATLEGWLEGMRMFTKRSPLTGALLAQVAGSLGRGLLEVASDVSGLIYLHGTTSMGKSTLTRALASLLGHPQKQDSAHPSPLIHANQTSVNFDRIAQSIRHGFMGIDEIQENQSAIADFLMRLANGMARGRSQLAGSTSQDQVGWDLTVIINGNDAMQILLTKTSLRDMKPDKFLEAIRARLIDIDIALNPVFPTDLPGNESPTAIHEANQLALMALEKHHGAPYPLLTRWLADNRERATQAFLEGERAYMARYTQGDFEDHLRRAVKMAGYQAVGFLLMREVMGFTEEEVAGFEATWNKLLDDNAEGMRKATAREESEADVGELLQEMDRLDLLTVSGYYALRDLDNHSTQSTNASTRHFDHRKNWLAHLDQPRQMTDATDFAGATLWLVPPGSPKWADQSLRGLRAHVEEMVRYFDRKDMIDKPKSGGGLAVLKTLGGKKDRFIRIQLKANPLPEPVEKTEQQLAEEQAIEDAWNNV